MKIWMGYGSEHSMNLVMIGHFATAGDAEAVKQAIEEMETAANLEMEAGRLIVGEPARRFPEAQGYCVFGLQGRELRFCGVGGPRRDG